MLQDGLVRILFGVIGPFMAIHAKALALTPHMAGKVHMCFRFLVIKTLLFLWQISGYPLMQLMAATSGFPSSLKAMNLKLTGWRNGTSDILITTILNRIIHDKTIRYPPIYFSIQAASLHIHSKYLMLTD